MKHEVLDFKWKGDEAYGEVMIFPHRSPEETGRTLKACVEVDAVLQVRKTILKQAPENFGDESYAWEGGGLHEGRFGYIFRRGYAVVLTSSSSLRAAGQLASLTLQGFKGGKAAGISYPGGLWLSRWFMFRPGGHA